MTDVPEMYECMFQWKCLSGDVSANIQLHVLSALQTVPWVYGQIEALECMQEGLQYED